ncbi:MAG: hypothetical protein K0R09_2603 [Clostridiales bacterium]|jgi:hypothetical protein|nr:hypothetical protein [Clostridiales bacterium]
MNSVFIFIGVFLILIGLIIWKLKIVRIIAGYDLEKVNDNDGLARWVGRNLVLMGMLIILLETIVIIFPNIKINLIILAYLIIVIGISIVTIVGTKRFEKKDKHKHYE